MENSRKPVANPSVLLREEFDDWAVLFNADTSDGFGLSPVGVYLWKLLDGERSIDDMLRVLRRDATDVPEEAGEQILAFVEELAQHGLVTYNAEQFHDGKERILSRLTTSIAENLPDGGHEPGQLGSGMLRYERPRLELFTLETRAHGNCQPGSGDSTQCNSNGNSASASSSYACKTVGNSASGGNWACGQGQGATGGGVACATGISATGGSGNTCKMGSTGGSCTNGGTA